MRRCVATVIAACFAVLGIHGGVYIEDGRLTDEMGRARMFRGVNVVFKQSPFIPDSHTYNTNTSMTDRDMADLAGWGINVVRLFVAWVAVEPSAGRYNETYLSELRALVDRFATYNISVILDAHQDVIARRFCGEGAADWATVHENNTAHSFPYPLPITLERDAHGDPLISSCLTHPFATYYFALETCKTFQQLYDATTVRDRFIAFWAEVARVFRSAPNVLGYELINEPWVGNLYDKPELLVPGVADRDNLAPLYALVHQTLRTVDQEKLVFFEPVTLDVTPAGFASNPVGGDAYRNRSVLSYHVYCGSNTPTRYHFGCDLIDGDFFLQRKSDIARLGVGGFLTEFGSLWDAPNQLGELNHVLDWSDRLYHSATYWQFKEYRDFTNVGGASNASFYNPDGTLQTPKVRVLTRAYASAVAGVPTRHHFEARTGRLEFEYVYAVADATTVVRMNAPLWYPTGVDVAIVPEGAAVANIVNSNTIHIVHKCALHTPLTVTVRGK